MFVDVSLYAAAVSIVDVSRLVSVRFSSEICVLLFSVAGDTSSGVLDSLLSDS